MGHHTNYEEPSTRILNKERKPVSCLRGLSSRCLGTFYGSRVHRTCPECERYLSHNRNNSAAPRIFSMGEGVSESRRKTSLAEDKE